MTAAVMYKILRYFSVINCVFVFLSCRAYPRVFLQHLKLQRVIILCAFIQKICVIADSPICSDGLFVNTDIYSLCRQHH